MSNGKPVHVIAKEGVRGSRNVIMSGDPNRMEFLAKRFFQNPQLFNDNRCEYGFVGEYDGMRILAQAHGIGRGSVKAYADDIIDYHDGDILIRLGTTGAYRPEMKLGEIVIPTMAYSDETVKKLAYENTDLGIAPNMGLCNAALKAVHKLGVPYYTGKILSSDYFKPKKGHENDWKLWAAFNLIAVEMESDMLFETARDNGARALTILTISDNIATGEEMPPEQRVTHSEIMFLIAMEVIRHCKK